MTALVISTDIPTNINTLEKLAAWVGLALQRCNPTLQLLESPEAEPQRAAQVVLIKADDGTFRMVIRASIPIVDDFPSNGLKFRQNAQTFSDVALPTAFKGN